jgi:hypothetical protein
MRTIICDVTSSTLSYVAGTLLYVNIYDGVFKCKEKTGSLQQLNAFFAAHKKCDIGLVIWVVNDDFVIEIPSNVVSITRQHLQGMQKIKCVDPMHNYLYVEDVEIVSGRLHTLVLNSEVKIGESTKYTELVVFKKSYHTRATLNWSNHCMPIIYNGKNGSEHLIVTRKFFTGILNAREVVVVPTGVGKLFASPVGKCEFSVECAKWKCVKL